MAKAVESASPAELLNHLKQVWAAAIEHVRAGRGLARERRRLIEALLAEGFSQADLARELGDSRQAIQKMSAGSKATTITEVSSLVGRRRPAQGGVDRA